MRKLSSPHQVKRAINTLKFHFFQSSLILNVFKPLLPLPLLLRLLTFLCVLMKIKRRRKELEKYVYAKVFSVER